MLTRLVVAGLELVGAGQEAARNLSDLSAIRVGRKPLSAAATNVSATAARLKMLISHAPCFKPNPGLQITG